METPLLEDHGGREPCRAAADHGDGAPRAIALGAGELTLAPGGRVDRTFDVPMVEDLVEAHQAADALADHLGPTPPGLVAPGGIGQMAAGNSHQVAAPLPQDRLRDLGLLDIGYGDDRNPDVLLDRRGHVFLPPLFVGTGLDTGQGGLGRGFGDAATDVEEIDAGLFQCHGDPAGGGEVIALVPQKLLGGEAHPEGEIPATGPAHTGEDLQQKPQAVLQAAAIVIVAAVEIGREEGIDQVPMGAVQFDPIGTRHLGDPRPGDESGLNALDLRHGQGPGRQAGEGMGDRRGGHGLLAEQELALPPGMMELKEHPGAVLVHRIHQPFETLEVGGAARGELVGFAGPRAIEDTAHAADDEAHPPLGPGLVKGDGVVVDTPARRGEVGAHGGHRHAVLDLQASDRDRAEQVGVHRLAPFPQSPGPLRKSGCRKAGFG